MELALISLPVVLNNPFTKVIAGLILSFLLTRVLRSVAKFIFKRTDLFDKRDERTVQSMFHSVIKYTVTLGFIIYLLSIFDVEFGSILAGAGIVGIIVSFSARNLIKDLLAGVLFLYENQFNKGDWIRINQTFEGSVEDIGFRSLQIRQWSGKLLMIRNSQVHTMQNYNKEKMRVIEHLTISFYEDPQRVFSMLEQACNRLNRDLGNTLKEDKDGNHIEPFHVYGVYALNDKNIGYQYTVTGLCNDASYFFASKETRRILAETMYENKVQMASALIKGMD
ncbi:mechanosensitive ion channel family protein [Aquibacillus rhizosphaerae]|uniref:Mechanosensitive ion channel family protein n=1 Tax=Aquibacillus rhizosphaerae TaxID=3051431 RepID=A0ABT7LBE4_9BACI|nr:mechanosensitive ion channel family protein [Aquibacillus sp. LR5S19]MDL4843176.1 mechanosensitive ion channel family protein [Aquibacillus sp. LR5S19]